MHYLLNNIDRKIGRRPDRSELNSGSLNIINAGADLFAGVLAAAFFYLLHNQCALRKATKEIREMFSTPSEICSGPKLNSCVYPQACIEERLRLAPPAPSHLPREVLPGSVVSCPAFGSLRIRRTDWPLNWSRRIGQINKARLQTPSIGRFKWNSRSLAWW